MTLHALDAAMCQECKRWHGTWSRNFGITMRTKHLESHNANGAPWIERGDKETILDLPDGTYLVDRDGDLWVVCEGTFVTGERKGVLHTNNQEYDCALIAEAWGNNELDCEYGSFLIVQDTLPPLDVPKFTSLADAEAWLEAHA